MNHILTDVRLPAEVIMRGRKRVKIPKIDEMTLDQKTAICELPATGERETVEFIWQLFFNQPTSHISYSDEYIADIFCAHVLQQVEQWNKAEAERLQYKPTPEEERAGFQKFSVFGTFATYDAIAKRLGKTHKEVGEMEYTIVFAMLWKDLMEFEYQRKLTDIYNEKARLQNAGKR